MYKQKGFDSGNGSGVMGGKKESPQDPKKSKSGTVAGQFLMPDNPSSPNALLGGSGAVDVDTGQFYSDPDQFLRVDELGFVFDDDYRYNDRGTITHRNDSTGEQIFSAHKKRVADKHRETFESKNKKKKNK